MEHFFEITIGLIAQFTGSKGGIEHGIVEFGIAGVFWLGLLILAYSRQRANSLPHEKLLLIGFVFGFCREMFMITMAILPAYGLFSVDSLHVFFPPLEHAIFDIALVVIAAGYMQYLLPDKRLSYQYLKIGIPLVLFIYLATAWWWGNYIIAQPESKFGQTWCDWFFRINISILLVVSMIIFLSQAKGWKRNTITIALLFLFLNQFFKMPDMILGEVYEQYFTPIRNGFYIFGIPIFGYVYIREFYEEKKQAEAAFQESRSKLLRAQYIARMGDFIWDLSSGTVTWSEGMHKLLKYDLNEKIDYAKVNSAIHHPDDLENVTKWLNDSIASGKENITPKEYRVVCKDGEILEIHTEGQVEYKGGKAVKLFGTSQDITKRKKTEKALKNNQNFLNRIINQSPFAIWVSDKKGTIIKCNPALEKLLNINDEQLIGQYNVFEDKIAIEQGLIPKIRTVFEDGKTANFSVEWDANEIGYKDAKKVYIEGTMFPIHDDNGNLTNVVNHWIDNTRRKQAEKTKIQLESQLQQAQKMESIGTLAGGIAHDFNNILSSILGFSRLIEEDLSNHDTELNDNIGEVITAAHRAKELVQHILVFSRHSDIEKKPLLLVPLIKETIKLLKASLSASIEIRTYIENEHATVLGDGAQIHQIVMNLCTNAACAMEKNGGILTIGLKMITLAKPDIIESLDLEPGDFFKLTISDTGQGIFQETIKQIFDPFFTTKEKGEGTGLGLSVVHGIVKEMNGIVNVESKLGKGTSFHVMMPVQKSCQTHGISTEEKNIERNEGRILFVDDDDTILRMADKTLKKAGYTITVVNSSLKALELFNSAPKAFDIVITDFDMPKMNGIELSNRILRQNTDIPIILCTGFAKGLTQEFLSEAGIHSMVMKPVMMSELITTVNSVLKSNH